MVGIKEEDWRDLILRIKREETDPLRARVRINGDEILEDVSDYDRAVNDLVDLAEADRRWTTVLLDINPRDHRHEFLGSCRDQVIQWIEQGENRKYNSPLSPKQWEILIRWYS